MKILPILLGAILVSIICAPVQGQSSVSKSWTITRVGFFINYMEDVEAFTLEITANWQSNTWTKGEDYTVGFSITGHSLHEYIDWIKVDYVTVQLRTDPTGHWYHDCLWTKQETKEVTLLTATIHVDCTLPEHQTYPSELYLIWKVAVEWQFTMDGTPYDRSDTYDNAELGPVYDPIPLSIKTPSSINWTLVIIIAVISIGAIGSIAYLVIRKRKAVLSENVR